MLAFERFDSKAEAERYAQLLISAGAGRIAELRRQVWFDLLAQAPNGLAIRVARYVADFRYLDLQTGRPVIEDVKGAITELARLKIKWMRAMGHEVRIVRMD